MVDPTIQNADQGTLEACLALLRSFTKFYGASKSGYVEEWRALARANANVPFALLSLLESRGHDDYEILLSLRVVGWEAYASDAAPNSAYEITSPEGLNYKVLPLPESAAPL